MKIGLALIAALLIAAPAFADVTIDPEQFPDLKPGIRSEDVVIQNTDANKPIILDDVKTVVAQKEAKRLARIEANKKLDFEYKTIPNKPSKIRHPFKRADLWVDYHQDTFRKYRTRGLPAGQGVATVIGMAFSIAAALR